MKLPERSLKTIYIPEPTLGFGSGQTSKHPKDGLYLYGPHSGGGKVTNIRVGVVGTSSGIELFQDQLHKWSAPIEVPPPGKTDKENRLHLSSFPGISEALGIEISDDTLVKRQINGASIDQATRVLNAHEAVHKTVDLYISEIEHHHNNEEQDVDVWILVLPEIIFERCKPKSKRTGLSFLKGDFGKKKPQAAPLLAFGIDMSEEAIFDDVPDFHRQVKARLLGIGKTSQLIRETTLAPEKFLNSAGYPTRGLQDEATLAWNLATGIYYKTRPNPPWKLNIARPGVCYMGLVFKKIPNDPKGDACCAAQMFLNEGDGIVFRGANGPWETRKNEYHLKKTAAENLIKTVTDTFFDKHGVSPNELFIHGRTKFNDEEWNAFVSACPEKTNLVGVRIQSTSGETKLFRNGDYPVLRGTAIILDDCNAYLWTNGFLPHLDTYIGPETPNPLFISILRSSGPAPKIEDVLTDIMGLTKINYNSCNYNDGLPVTVRFADKVGDVLVMGSAKGSEKQPFKFYI